jgi:hypothetical protein
MSGRPGNKLTRGFGLAILFWVLLLIGCKGSESGGEGTTAAEETELPVIAQRYLALSLADLSAQLNVAPEEIELESITSSADVHGVYEVRLVVAGRVYQYQGQGEHITLMGEEATTEP